MIVTKAVFDPSRFPFPLMGLKMHGSQKQAANFRLACMSYKVRNAMRVNDVSNQLLHLSPADDLPLQMTGKAAFQQCLIDISSLGKLLPSIARLWADVWAQ